MTTCRGDWRSEWASDISGLLQKAEDAEQALSYLSPCGSEAARKKLGSYYTPADVALFFWTEFLALNSIEEAYQVTGFWERHHFIEPAAGAGTLVLALLKKGGELGLSLHHLATTNLTIIDINQTALNFIRNQLTWLADRWGIIFRNISYICCDFRNHDLSASPLIPLFFGNPPFVTNPRGSKWKNLFADFLERALRLSGPEGHCHFILPVSIAFSRDYTHLRNHIRDTGKSVALSSFDNIPDTLFPSGKPEHTNTNKANSQRCSILSIFSSETPRVMSTKMHRWRKRERTLLLTSPPRYHDVSKHGLNDQFLRPENAAILRYLGEVKDAPRFNIFISEKGSHSLLVASVARNFIGFREDSSSGTHHLRFDTKKALYSALLILSSDVFFDYWRTVGDGFHLTRTNLMEFPLHRKIMQLVGNKTAKGRAMWKKRKDYAKTKRHPNGVTVSYDFRSSALSLVDKF